MRQSAAPTDPRDLDVAGVEDLRDAVNRDAAQALFGRGHPGSYGQIS